MKNILALLLIFGLLISCKNETKELAYSSYGKEITDTDALSSDKAIGQGAIDQAHKFAATY